MAEGTKRLALLAIDGSEYAEYAFDWYSKYMHHPDNEVLLVHVPDNFDVNKAQKELARTGSMKAITENQYSQITELEERYHHKLFVNHMRGRVLSIPSKTVGQTLLETAKEEGAFAVIMGTRGRSKLKKALLGSVSDYLVKNADRPVIVVRKFAGDKPT